MKPIPVLAPAELRVAALAVIKADPFPMLASLDGNQVRVRPVSPVRTEEFTVYVASMRSSGKTNEIAANNKVELCYLSEGHDQVRITGEAENITDPAVRQNIWDSNPLLRAYLKSVDNPEFILYKISPNRVRYMKEWALEYQTVEL
ncbi:MAG TPA: pyridoxamine 5'-phosphate oxidase family protein [Bryobacteraceae bacterium]|nr:pyridoxamine 5'-phosphate oxidase family protein [Bryobacteraceae bacterium]